MVVDVRGAEGEQGGATGAQEELSGHQEENGRDLMRLLLFEAQRDTVQTGRLWVAQLRQLVDRLLIDLHGRADVAGTFEKFITVLKIHTFDYSSKKVLTSTSGRF